MSKIIIVNEEKFTGLFNPADIKLFLVLTNNIINGIIIIRKDETIKSAKLKSKILTAVDISEKIILAYLKNKK